MPGEPGEGGRPAGPAAGGWPGCPALAEASHDPGPGRGGAGAAAQRGPAVPEGPLSHGELPLPARTHPGGQKSLVDIRPSKLGITTVPTSKGCSEAYMKPLKSNSSHVYSIESPTNLYGV